MSLIRVYLVVCLGGLAGAVAGGVAGYLIGITVPGYYRGVFPSGGKPWFDPVQVGVGLGISQGILAGLAVGGIVVVAVTGRRRLNLPAS